jgi:H+/Na+-translocating ferredoxin:NAD+ oxidoreductase subunit C
MKTFKRGGAHPPDMKELSAGQELERIESPAEVVIPVIQHIGAPSKAIVRAGDLVLKGQVVAEANGFVSVPQHTPVSGKVTKVEIRKTAMGRSCDHIVIESDGRETWASGCNVEMDWRTMGVDHIKVAVKSAGVVGMGGAAFPTHVKLSPPKDRPIDTLILNGVECEPYLTCDYRIMLEHARGITDGLKIIMRALGVEKAIIGIEANKPDAFEKMRDTVWADDNISVEMLDVKYPQGAEKQLIQALTGREVPPGRLPLDVGVVVQNVATAYAVFEAVAWSRPLIERAVTVTGDGVSKPANLVVPVGTSIRSLLIRQGIDPKTKKIVLGGPMMGPAVSDAELPLVKGTSGVLALKKVTSLVPGPCIRCGKCVEVCPLRGMAAEMIDAIEHHEVERYEELHVLDCMECGTCAFACPSHRSMVQYVKIAKAEYQAWKAKKDE